MWGESSCRCWADTNASFFTYKAGVFTGVQWQLLSNNTMKILILIFCILHHIDGKPYSNSLDFEHHIVPRIKPFEKPSFEGIDSQLITLMVSNYCLILLPFLKLLSFCRGKVSWRISRSKELKCWLWKKFNAFGSLRISKSAKIHKLVSHKAKNIMSCIFDIKIVNPIRLSQSSL